MIEASGEITPPGIATLRELLEWGGDTDSLIREMKLFARCETDGELAAFLGKARTAVANWRSRQLVPESAILRLAFRLRS